MKIMRLFALAALLTVTGITYLQANETFTITNNAVKPGSDAITIIFGDGIGSVNTPTTLTYQKMSVAIPQDATSVTVTTKLNSSNDSTTVLNKIPINSYTSYSITTKSDQNGNLAWAVVPV